MPPTSSPSITDAHLCRGRRRSFGSHEVAHRWLRDDEGARAGGGGFVASTSRRNSHARCTFLSVSSTSTRLLVASPNLCFSRYLSLPLWLPLFLWGEGALLAAREQPLTPGGGCIPRLGGRDFPRSKRW
jgi:hypothetical protein